MLFPFSCPPDQAHSKKCVHLWGNQTSGLLDTNKGCPPGILADQEPSWAFNLFPVSFLVHGSLVGPEVCIRYSRGRKLPSFSASWLVNDGEKMALRDQVSSVTLGRIKSQKWLSILSLSSVAPLSYSKILSVCTLWYLGLCSEWMLSKVSLNE